MTGISGGGWLEGDVAFITGGGSGIGRAVADRYLAEGASVAIFGRGQDKLKEVVDASIAPEPRPGDRRRRPRHRSPAQRRAADRGHVRQAGYPGAQRRHLGLQPLGHPAQRGELADTFDELFAINVKGYLLTVEAAWRELVKSRGSIVMTLSNSSFHTAGGGIVYTASKFACRGLVTQLAYELAPKVRVNGVAVGGMNTDLRGPESIGLKDRSISDSFARSEITGHNPLIPLHDASVDPKDFTGSYVLLASRSNASNITGEIIPADGGIAVRGFGTALQEGTSL